MSIFWAKCVENCNKIQLICHSDLTGAQCTDGGGARTRGTGDESATGITQISARNYFIDFCIHCVDLLWEVFNEEHVSFNE